MKKRFTLSLIALIASAVLFVVTSFAWFVLNGTAPVGSIPRSAGGIIYDLGGDFIAGSVIYPDLNVVGEEFSITNYSPEDMYIRVKIEYTKIDVTYDNINYTYNISTPVQKYYEDTPENEHLEVSMNSRFFYESDGYWYLDEPLEDSVYHTIISSIKYDGFKVSNEYADSDIFINIIIEMTTDNEGIWSPLTTLAYVGNM